MEGQNPAEHDCVERSTERQLELHIGRPVIAVEAEGTRVVMGLSHGVKEGQVFIRDTTEQLQCYDQDNWHFFIADQATLELFAALHDIDTPSENGYRST